MATAASSRVARLSLEKGVGNARSSVTAATPKDISAKEFTMIRDLARGLTGCPSCHSGGIDLIFRDEFERVLNVDLATGKQF